MSAATAYVLLEDGARFEGVACGADTHAVGEIVFTTSMSGYQEAISDPSYAGQLIVFTYPQIGNYGVSAEAMESDRIHARAAIMRAAVDHDDAPGADAGWLTWLSDCGIPAITDLDTRALVRHIRDRGAMRGGLFPARTSEAQAQQMIAAEPAMTGRDLAREVTPSEPTVLTRTGAADRDDRHRRQIVDRPQSPGPRRRGDASSVHCERGRAARDQTPTRSSSPTAPAIPAHSTTSSPWSGSWSASCRSTGSASDTSSSAARSASRPTSCRSATTAPTTRSRT